MPVLSAGISTQKIFPMILNKRHLLYLSNLAQGEYSILSLNANDRDSSSHWGGPKSQDCEFLHLSIPSFIYEIIVSGKEWSRGYTVTSPLRVSDLVSLTSLQTCTTHFEATLFLIFPLRYLSANLEKETYVLLLRQSQGFRQCFLHQLKSAWPFKPSLGDVASMHSLFIPNILKRFRINHLDNNI